MFQIWYSNREKTLSLIAVLFHRHCKRFQRCFKYVEEIENRWVFFCCRSPKVFRWKWVVYPDLLKSVMIVKLVTSLQQLRHYLQKLVKFLLRNSPVSNLWIKFKYLVCNKYQPKSMLTNRKPPVSLKVTIWGHGWAQIMPGETVALQRFQLLSFRSKSERMRS